MRKRFGRFSRRASEEETLDVHKAVNRMIDRLLEDGRKTGKTQAELRQQLESVVEAIQGSPPMGALSPEEMASPTTGEIYLKLQPHPNYLTPKILVETIGAYLNALGQIQSVANEVRGAGNHPLNVISIQHGNPIRVMLTNTDDALAVVRDVVVPWMQANSTDVARIADSLQQSEFTNTSAERNKIDLATEVISKLAPGMDDRERLTFLARILPAIHTLMFSEIMLVA